jgi:trk system potassium uptake protein TrkH
MALIVAGGLGFLVLREIGRAFWQLLGRRERRYASLLSYHSQVVLVVSGVLIVGGTVMLWGLSLFGRHDQETLSFLDALFQSVTARTAGFNSVPIGALPISCLLTLIALMFIGGSPASTAGGIKTSSFAVWVARLSARLAGRQAVTLMGQQIPTDLVRRTSVLIALSGVFNVVGALLLSLTEQADPAMHFEHLLFEQISAFGTVGLSTGITPVLSVPGKLWIVLTMFVGRLGPMTIATWVVAQQVETIHYPHGRLMIG